MHRRELGISALGLMAAAATGARPAAAQAPAYPTRTVTIVAPFAAGGSTDLIARLIAQPLSARLNQQFVVDNRAGANGAVGSGFVARARPDGYTLLVTPNSTYAINPHLYSSLPYNQERDFAPIGLLVQNGFFLCVRGDSPFRTVADFVAAARAAPDTISFGSGGIGSANHLAPEMFAAANGVKLQHVPYRGSGPAMQAVISGEIPMSFVDTGVALPFMRSGDLRALAVSSEQRSAQAPDVPTLAESGTPGLNASSDFAMFAPANTPQPIIRRISEAVIEGLRTPDLRERLQGLSIDAVGGTPEAFPAYLAAESAKWRDVIRARDIRVE
ncbi:Bug family tripartite tricarboxylate transporter substrate binding protein [Muricoccus aerilatus]|uniref:Bug family tripartite tricarboxylate transporter substrate binding protein n=1 Tax=Muricoccus aerilatus TaxID=452982 RepID=UPI0005C25CEA|nr:tripartite tricarboxylate transporter substrate binding protein [Roseomonas aerilata]